MKLTARITLHTPKGVVQPGESIEIKDKDEAAYLISIGAAADPAASAAPVATDEAVQPPEA
ncbi:hypothetical protein B447_17631 [Thauera sp. 27]|uniref:hypothetical protein n=1 Tax=Thauera sp. 27 TaxID=305700 RepID=UPI0002CF7B4E|nr:hypothetical protein [Thauera sp. 27]ENO76588.1 hypothetical protein B447_17631 [Thauera sp. 27]